jgi:hypothetical protein
MNMNESLHRLIVSAALAGLLMIGGSRAQSADDVGSAPPASEFPAPSAELVKSIQELLEEGFTPGPKRLQEAKKKLESARQLSNADPRLDYAYCLVLLKQSQQKQAIVQFEAAVGRGGAPYWPAWQALIWTQLIDRQYEAGLDRLEQYAALVRKSGDPSETTEAQRDAVRWMGQILEGLDKSLTAKKLREMVERREVRLRESLGDDLSETLDLGRDIVDEREAALSEQAGLAQEAVEKRQARRRESQAEKLESNLDNLGKERENAKKGAEDRKKSFDETLAKADKKLGLLEKDYQALVKRSESLQQSIILIGREITSLDVQLNMNNNLPQNQQRFMGQAAQQLMQRQNQMLNYQLEYNATIGRMEQTSRQGQITLRERAAIVQKYEKATGELVKKNAELDKWAARVADKKKKLDVQATGKAAKKGSKTAADRRVLTLKSYVPLDLDAEKARVLEAYGVKPNEPAALKDVPDQNNPEEKI